MKPSLRMTIVYDYEPDICVYLVESSQLTPIPDGDLAYTMAALLVRRQSHANTVSFQASRPK